MNILRLKIISFSWIVWGSDMNQKHVMIACIWDYKISNLLVTIILLFKVSSRLMLCGEKSLKIYTWKDIQYFSCLEGAPPPKILCQFTKYSKLLLVF